MKQIRLHGRGGQGVVTAAELIAIAAYADGRQAQAFPSFGVERTGAPIQAFARIDDKFIRNREQVYHPDILIILDPTLIGLVDMTSDCGKGIKIIVNTTQPAGELKLTYGPKKLPVPVADIFAVDASKIAMEILGRNLANTTILGVLAKAIDLVSINGLREAIKEKFEEKGEEIVNKNINAIEKAYNS
ncbi:MAG: 2-oxoacid:acceptor oxidoreductase family protein [Patescibacteria group bacterium]|nr:2-oxoacid:acceptor oxidoreductase family protein [Patescibacteria group bacterium]